MSCDNYVKYLKGKLIRDSALRVFFGGWLCRHLLPGMYQNTIEGEQMSSINHIVHCTNRLGTRSSLISSEMVGILLKYKFPDSSQRPVLQTHFSKDSSFNLDILTPFCTPTFRILLIASEVLLNVLLCVSFL